MKVHDSVTDSGPELGLAGPGAQGALVHIERGLSADLEAWGHAGHLVLLQRLVAPQRDSPVERGLFWCETCKLWLLARLAEPSETPRATGPTPDGFPVDARHGPG